MDTVPSPAHQIRNLLAESDAARGQGAYRHGASLARQAADLAASHGDVGLAAEAQAMLARHQVALGDVEGAVASCQRALAGAGPAALLSQAHSTLSMAYERAGLHQLAVAHAASALELARACGDANAECWALNRLGTAADDADGERHGLDLLIQALELSHQLPALDVRVSALNNLSRRWVLEADRLAGEPARQALLQALPLAETAAAVVQSMPRSFSAATVQANLGGIHRRLGHVDLARQHFAQALVLARAQGYAGLQATVELALASMAFEVAPDPASQHALVQQLDAGPPPADPDLRLRARRQLVQGCRARGDLATALDQLERLHAEELAARERRADLQTRLLFNRTELAQARHTAEHARLDAELQRLRADAEQRAAAQLALDRDLLEREVAARTAELQRAKTVAEAASRAKSVFLSIVSHELRTPLNGIMGLLELARRRAADDRQADQLARALAAGRQLNGLFDNLLNYVALDAQARMQAEPTDLRALLASVQAAHATAAQAKGLVLQVQVPAVLPARVLLDGQRLGQILEVLVDNAVKFSAAGTVLLQARWQPAAGGPAQLRLEVADDGPGIDGSQLERLFRPFEPGDPSLTRPQGGLGLGLALAQRLAEAMGATLGLDPHRRSGCAFWVDVPIDTGFSA
ncbi:ATP-binding protein [Pseudaquabacterium pictum]|uniref:histidine kinase n=1 Tax=Pseudaquabacterium pictum TaxID=2315236 RepID=A0A480ATT9_9BURK|nr:ATP-binding protein [Rubrivivax pictus]GCL64280.1 hypothetical protein AQPW35_33610 [Rubrivivax pictus]